MDFINNDPDNISIKFKHEDANVQGGSEIKMEKTYRCTYMDRSKYSAFVGVVMEVKMESIIGKFLPGLLSY